MTFTKYAAAMKAEHDRYWREQDEQSEKDWARFREAMDGLQIMARVEGRA